jgi:DnaK suppressor protein
MDKKTIEKYKKILEEKEKQITKDLEQIAEKNRHHQDENANEIADYESLLSTEQNIEVDLVAIKKALERIEKGTYGFCEKCGKEINQKRLDAFPEANFCIDCEKNKKK